MSRPKIRIEVVNGNGIGPHGNGPSGGQPIGRGHTTTLYNSKPIGFGTTSMPERGDRNNAFDTSFDCNHDVYAIEFQKYFLVKNLKVLLEKQVKQYPHQQQRLLLNGQVLEDDKELSEYGITAASAGHLTLKMYLIDDSKLQTKTMLESKRRYADGQRTWQESVNPTGMTGHDFATTIGHYMP